MEYASRLVEYDGVGPVQDDSPDPRNQLVSMSLVLCRNHTSCQSWLARH